MPGSRLLLLALLAAAAAVAAPVAARAQTVNVQIVNVCDDAGNNCALSGPYAKYSYDPATTPAEIQSIFNQAGITVNLLAPVQYDSTAFLNPAVIDDPAHGYLTGSPTDPAHQLLSQAGHSQNTDPNVLDVYVVNSLVHNPDGSGAATGSPLFGLGLENSNGAVVATAPTAPDSNGNAYVAGIDNIAHELGHNLGLLHVDATADSSPYNLLQGTGRYVPQTICGISGVTCGSAGNVVDPGSPAVATTGRKDTLNTAQIAQVQSAAAHLFSAGGATATANASRPSLYDPCSFGTDACAVSITVNPNGTTQSLVGVKLRFQSTSKDPELPLLSSPAMPYFFNDACGAQSTVARLNDGSNELGYTFTPGCFNGPIDLGPAGLGDAYTESFNIPVLDPTYGTSEAETFPDYDLSPFSVQFTFADGTTTTSLFDSSGTATSATPVASGNVLAANQAGPGLSVPTDPALFNTLSHAEDEATLSIQPNGTVTPLYTEATNVPEPTSLALLGTGLLLLSGRRARRR